MQDAINVGPVWRQGFDCARLRHRSRCRQTMHPQAHARLLAARRLCERRSAYLERAEQNQHQARGIDSTRLPLEILEEGGPAEIDAARGCNQQAST
jgi:hypothetical protein